LVRLAREAGLRTGVVFDTHPEKNGLARAVDHLQRKVDAGAQFAVTQPVYDEPGADEIADVTRNIGIPVIMGILPLRTPRHAEFLHTKVAGISVPDALRQRMQRCSRPGGRRCCQRPGNGRSRPKPICRRLHYAPIRSLRSNGRHFMKMEKVP
jgi:methylenetetrahydrofolate reductase (NADPH)